MALPGPDRVLPIRYGAWLQLDDLCHSGELQAASASTVTSPTLNQRHREETDSDERGNAGHKRHGHQRRGNVLERRSR
jgi:hypothetical protein